MRCRLSVRVAILALVFLVMLTRNVGAEGPKRWVRVSEDRTGFVLAPGGGAFVPWGFNYDHDEKNRLLEEYWEGEWPKVEEDFAEMKALGAKVVRIHLQVSAFLREPDEPNEKALERFEKLLRLAEKTGLFLDVTGLGCYRKSAVPAWYDALDDAERWRAQTRFWRGVAERGSKSEAIFCYDLMNEPVVSGTKRKAGEWLGGAFGDFYYVQFINLDGTGRDRKEVARQWIEAMTAAVRSVDARHLVTVGMVDWSLDRPGLTSGFDPKVVAGPLDFIAVHLYPEAGAKKLDEAMATLRGFSVGKPVVIEETFPLKSGFEDFRRFVVQSKIHAAGLIGFYWGKTVSECRKSGTLGDAITAGWLDFFQELVPKQDRP